jgi:hypothetical protein
MAVKTFTAGETATASDTNTYLANSGLVYITSGALSGTDTHYKILIDDITPSASISLVFQFLVGVTPNTTADYNWAFTGLRTDAVAIDVNGQNQTFGFTGISGGVAADSVGFASLDVFGPQTTTMRTIVLSSAYSYPAEWGARNGGSHFNSFTAFDGIRFLTNSAATVTGNVTIYGYRKA